MALNGKADQANNAPIWAAAQVNKAPNTANRDALYGNTTANGYGQNLTSGVFAVDDNEVSSLSGKVTHAGWVLRTVGSGGRAGRVTYETLVAGGISSDAEDTIFSDVTITISVDPVNKTVNTNSPTTFSVGAVSVPIIALSYQWQANTGSGFANLSAAGVYSNVTTSTLSISNVAGLNNYSYRVLVMGTGGNTVTSANAKLTVS